MLLTGEHVHSDISLPHVLNVQLGLCQTGGTGSLIRGNLGSIFDVWTPQHQPLKRWILFGHGRCAAWSLADDFLLTTLSSKF